jgi:hypothetical protein
MESPVSSSPTLDVVIVNWRSDEYLARCLASLPAAASPAFDFGKVVVVENECRSEPSPWERCARGLPVHAIRNSQNAGFARACNQGARAGSADYILFLNPDVILNETSLDLPLRYFSQAQKSVGICGIRLLDDHGRPSTSHAYFPTPKRLLVEALGIDKLPGHTHRGRTVDPELLSRSGFVDQIMGAFFLVRRSVYDGLGGFDERFFVYFEEVDFSMRAAQRGYRSYYLADATANHHGGASSNQVLDMRLFYVLRSRIQYARKHFRWPALCGLVAVMLTLEPLCRIAWALINRQSDSVSQTVKAYWKLWHFLVLETGA